jgi:hypothetical protein
VFVLRTLGAPQRRLLRGRKPAAVSPGDVEPEPVPTARATLVAASAFDSAEDAAAWLDALRRDEDALAGAVDAAVRELNTVLRAHRVAALDPYAREVSAGAALVARVGYGAGEQVAEGRFAEAYELPRSVSGEAMRGAARRRAALQPQERLAAILGGRDRVLAGEDLLLRAQADVDAGDLRSAALQARVALEALIAELGREGRDIAALRACRRAVGEAANAALEGDLPPEAKEAVTDAVEEMERALRHRAHAG